MAVITLFPVKAIRKSDGLEITILGQRRKEDSCLIYGSAEKDGASYSVEIVVGDENYNIEELQPDSVEGYVIVFPDVEKDIIGKWVKASRDNVMSSRKISRKEIPTDRTFRDAWRDDGKKIVHNMDKVREIHLAKLRESRVAILEDLDKEWMKAMGQSNQQKVVEVEGQRQKLRDMPVVAQKLIAKAKSIEKIKGISIDKFA